MRGGVMLYYFKYYVGREDLFSIFNVCGLGSTIVGVVASTPLAKRFGKRDVFIVGLGADRRVHGGVRAAAADGGCADFRAPRCCASSRTDSRSRSSGR